TRPAAAPRRVDTRAPRRARLRRRVRPAACAPHGSTRPGRSTPPAPGTPPAADRSARPGSPSRPSSVLLPGRPTESLRSRLRRDRPDPVGRTSQIHRNPRTTASGARMRVRAAGFPALKTLEDFDWRAQPSAEKPLLLHLAQLAWIEERANVCFFGPPGTGKTHCAIALAIKACERGHRGAFATAQAWVSRLEASPDRNQPE